jgi:mono/diheme cytochrome c family protein
MKYFFLVLTITGLTACGAGSGDGLNEQGLPSSSSNGNSSASSSSSSSTSENGVTLAQLQQTIFGAVCTNCHTGANAPRGLRLDSDENSYAFLVNRAADEIPTLMRVNPGKPDDSYLIKKLEGTADIVGARMPLGGPYLSQEQINQVRSWIANGAPRTGTGSATTKIARASAQKLNSQVTIDLHFSRTLQFETLSPDSISVFYRNLDGQKIATDFSLLLLDQILYITVKNLPEQAIQLEVLVNHSELHPLLDNEQRVFDGDGDENQGGGYSYVYSL